MSARRRLTLSTCLALAALAAGPVDSGLAQTFSFNFDADNFEGGFVSFVISCADTGGGADDCIGATVNFATQDNTAVSTGGDADYTSLANTVTFTGAGIPQGRDVATVNDALDEDNETFFANLSSPSSGTITDNQAIGTINDGDPLPVVSINNASADEGLLAPFTVTLTPVSGRTVMVQVDTLSGTATDGDDFGSLTDFVLQFDAGETSLPLSISHFCDDPGEGTENYSVDLNTPTNATVSTGGAGAGDPGTGTIFDTCVDDGSGGGSGTSGGADLYILKQETADPVQVGIDYGYTLGVHNSGSAVAQNVTVIDNLPAGLQFVSATPSQGTCSGTTTVTCNLLSINPGATHFIAIRVRPTTATVIQNTATVTSSTFDPFTANNSSTALTQSYLGGTPPAGIPNPGASIATLHGSRTCEWSEGRMRGPRGLRRTWSWTAPQLDAGGC